VASDPADIRRLLGKVRAELARRAGGGTDRQLWLLVVDEYTALQRGELGEEITATIEAVTQEGRKLAVICLLLGQRWSATRSGGGDLRNTLTNAFVHRMRPEDARMLTGMRADQLLRDTAAAGAGRVLRAHDVGRFTRVVTPRLTDADVAAFTVRLTGSITGSDAEPAGQGANDPQYEEVRSWILQGIPYGEIRDRLIGKHATKGRAAQDASQRITAILQAIALEALYTRGDEGSQTGP